MNRYLLPLLLLIISLVGLGRLGLALAAHRHAPTTPARSAGAPGRLGPHSPPAP